MHARDQNRTKTVQYIAHTVRLADRRPDWWLLYSAAVRGRATLAGDTVLLYSSITQDARHATGPGVFTSLYMQYVQY